MVLFEVMENNTYIYDETWAAVIRQLLRTAKAESGMTYDQISLALEERFGIHQTPANIKGKFNKVNFGAQLFTQLLIVMGKHQLDLDELYRRYLESKN